MPNGTYFRFGMTIERRVIMDVDALWAPKGPPLIARGVSPWKRPAIVESPAGATVDTVCE